MHRDEVATAHGTCVLVTLDDDELLEALAALRAPTRLGEAEACAREVKRRAAGDPFATADRRQRLRARLLLGRQRCERVYELVLVERDEDAPTVRGRDLVTVHAWGASP